MNPQHQHPQVLVRKSQNDGRTTGPQTSSSSSVPHSKSSRSRHQSKKPEVIVTLEHYDALMKEAKLAKSWQQNFEKLQFDHESLVSQHSKLVEEHSVVNTGKKSLENELRSLQETMFRSLESSHWMPMDAGTVATKLDNIRTSIGKVAKAYAATNDALDAVCTSPTALLTHLRSSLRHVVNFRVDGPDAIAELKTVPQACRLALTALISYDVHNLVLREPFFFMVDGPKDDDGAGPPSSVEGTLRQVWSEGCKYDKEKANIWRSDTLRLLNPMPQREDSEPATAKVELLMAAVDESCAIYAFNSVQKLPKMLLRKHMEDATRAAFGQEVTELFQEAGRLSLSLWVQRPSVHCEFLAHLAGRRFDSRAVDLKAHPLHKHDDVEDLSLNGKRVKVVVHPAIVAAGTHEGERYDECQYLAPAIVWLDEIKAAE